jgi:hypothetical protein
MSVIPGLVPGIHEHGRSEVETLRAPPAIVDGRDKPGHDGKQGLEAVKADDSMSIEP